MVRPLRPEDEDESSVMFQGPRTSGGGIMGGSGGGNMQNIASQGGRFAASEGLGTGFVNADQYLKANQGKGEALGEKVTVPVSQSINNLSEAYDGLAAENTSWNPDPERRAGEDGDWKGKGFDKASDYYDWLSRSYEISPEKYRGPSKEMIQDRLKNLERLTKGDDKTIGVNDWKGKLDPNMRSGRDARAQLIQTAITDYNKDPYNTKKISYNPTLQGFDAMFMESESPDLIDRKFQSLSSILSRTAGYGTIGEDKLREIDDSTRKAEEYTKGQIEGYKWRTQEELAREKAEKDKGQGGQPQNPGQVGSGSQNPPPKVSTIEKEDPTWGDRGIRGGSSGRDQPSNGPRGIPSGRPNTGRGSREIPPTIKVEGGSPQSGGTTRGNSGGTSVEQSRKQRQRVIR